VELVMEHVDIDSRTTAETFFHVLLAVHGGLGTRGDLVSKIVNSPA
jgi:hypothetical protein